MRLFGQSAEEKEALATARADFEAFAHAASTSSPEQVRGLAIAFRANPNVSALSDKERRQRCDEAFRAYAANVLADDHLTIDEEMAFHDVSEALGINQQAFEGTYRDIQLRLVVAKINDGRLPYVDSPHLMTKKNELVHLETAAALMKEVSLREWRAGSSGFSFKVAKGVRYRVGQTRGH